MRRAWNLIAVAIGILIVWPLSSHAQLGARQDAANIIAHLPPDIYAKVEALATLLDRGIKEGRLTEAEVQQGLISGNLGEKLRTMHPDASRLLDELKEAMKNGSGPGEDGLLPLLGGLGIAAP
jgi:hypothetical protein